MFYRIISALVLFAITACNIIEPIKLVKSTEDEDGVGGTGHTKNFKHPDIYISGHITAFGSIYVNSAHVKYNAKTIIKVDGIQKPHYKFTLGEVVELRASGRRSSFGSFIHVVHEVSGRVSRVDPRSRNFTILGQTIRLHANKMTLPKVGEWLKVSGYTDDQFVIHASSINRSIKGNSLLSGYVYVKHNRFYIRNILITNKSQLAGIKNGYLIVTGRYSHQGFRVNRARKLENIRRFSSIKKLVIRGYITRMPDGSYTLGKLGIRLSKRQAKKKLGRLLTLEALRNNRGDFYFEKFQGYKKGNHPEPESKREHQAPDMNEAPDIDREVPDIDRSASEDRDRERPGP